jgi:hypothetical protein
MANSKPDSWTCGLQRNGEYYEGVVSSLDDRLEAHKRETVTTWGTRTSSSNSKPADDCEKTIVSSSYTIIKTCTHTMNLNFFYRITSFIGAKTM